MLKCFLSQGGSLHGKYVDATPFANSEKKDNEDTNGEKSKTLVDELGEMLKVKGFNYHGVEVLYSGVYGTELTCEIFIGPVYYQRLRHMVSDKFQVDSQDNCFLRLIQPECFSFLIISFLTNALCSTCRFALQEW